MLIILEGPDCGGKSSLAAKLKQREPSFEIWHKGPPTSHPLDEYESPLFGYDPGAGKHIICDRWHLGEAIYPHVLGRETKMDTSVFRHIEMFLRSRGALLIICNPSPDTLIDRLESRGDDLINRDHVHELHSMYMSMTTSSCLRQLSPNVRLETIVSTAKNLAALSRTIYTAGSYIGPRDPHVLLVGERTNYAPPFPPAFGPYPATSGRWLMRSIATLHYDNNRYGLANAYEEDLVRLWKSLGNPRVVALGRTASTQLKVAGVPHGAVPHPQFVRRFLHAEGDWYQGLIDKATRTGEDLITCRP